MKYNLGIQAGQVRESCLKVMDPRQDIWDPMVSQTKYPSIEDCLGKSRPHS